MRSFLSKRLKREKYITMDLLCSLTNSLWFGFGFLLKREREEGKVWSGKRNICFDMRFQLANVEVRCRIDSAVSCQFRQTLIPDYKGLLY
jgi:hypothetical protein